MIDNEKEIPKVQAIQAFRAAMKLANITYEQLSIKLCELGEHQKPESLRNKISRGDFSAKFFFQCLHLMEVNFYINNK